MTHDALLAWLAACEPKPPAGLVLSVKAAVTEADLTPAGGVPEALAEAAFTALDLVVASRQQGRRVAADLLAADALITYALEAQGALAPDAMAPFANALAERAGAGV